MVRRGLVAVRLTPRRPPTGYVAGGSLVRNFRAENGSRSRKKRTPHSEPPHLQASAPLACNLPPSSVGPTGCHLGPLTQKLDVPLSSFLHTKLCGRFTATTASAAFTEKGKLRRAWRSHAWKFSVPGAGMRLFYIWNRINQRQRREQGVSKFGLWVF